MTIKEKPILLCPVGNHEMLQAAINAKANAVYLGIKGLNMRDTAKNFDINELPSIVELAHNNNIEVYLTVNIIIFNNELEKIRNILIKAKEANIDAIICWDLSVIKLCRELGLHIHLSTQASVSNIEALKQYYSLGIERFILARECSLEQIIEITKQAKEISKDIEIEVFIHGAMCVAVSGRCFMSQFLYGDKTSANRGKCIQPCRREYIIKDSETNKELELHNNYVLSPKDLCTLPFIEKILDSGVDVLKIEGRGRSCEYVKIVTECYNEAINAYKNNTLNQELKDKLIERLKTVYNRDFSSGFYLGKPINEWTNQYGTKATKRKTYIGKITKVFKKINVAEVKLESNDIKVNDNILIIGNKTGVLEQKVDSIQLDVNTPLEIGKKGQTVAIKLETLARPYDKVYLFG